MRMPKNNESENALIDEPTRTFGLRGSEDLRDDHPSRLLASTRACYHTRLGAAYLGESHQLLRALPDKSVNVVVTSPPYALHFKKEYGNVSKEDYTQWFLPFAKEIHRVLADDGSFVLNIGGSYNKGTPTR